MAGWADGDSERCVTMSKIGRIRNPDDIEGDLAKMDEILRAIPLTVPDVDLPYVGGRFTCRVWFRAALRKLTNDENHFVRVTDINGLEKHLVTLSTALQYRGHGSEPAILAPSIYTL